MYIENTIVAVLLTLFCKFPQNIRNYHKHGFKLQLATAIAVTF